MGLCFNNLPKEFVVVILGATGTGKSKLSIELAVRLLKKFGLKSEIINSDKMQVHKGLNITTNKVPVHERNGVPHHLLDVKEPFEDLSPSDYRSMAEPLISEINERGNIPILVGGSNSWIHALLVEQYDPASKFFSSVFRYECCFLWLDVESSVLLEYSSERVDKLLDSEDIFTELAEFFDPEAKDLELDSVRCTGLRKAIGVAEFDRYFEKYPPPEGLNREWRERADMVRKAAYEEAVAAVKENTCRLVEQQMEKILMLKEAGWDLQRLDATAAFEVRGTSREAECIKKLLDRSLEIVTASVEKWMKENKKEEKKWIQLESVLMWIQQRKI